MDSNNLRNSEKSEVMKNNYGRWKLEALDEVGYFVIFQGFLENGKLKNISGNALKLYIYLGLNSNNFEGIVWHSNGKIARYFKKSERTIRSWMNELETLSLIKRMRLKYNGNVYTYLQPYAYKYNPEAEHDFNHIIEGDLCIDDTNSLYIKENNIYIPITSSMYIEAWDNEENTWISGKIEIRRSINDWFFDESKGGEQMKYVFKSYDRSLIINIKKDIPLKVRILIV